MKNPRLVYEIVSRTVKAIQKPVTVKIRKGFDDTCVNAVEIAPDHRGGPAQPPWRSTAGTREQYYAGKADWGHHPPGEAGRGHPGHRERGRHLRGGRPQDDG